MTRHSESINGRLDAENPTIKRRMLIAGLISGLGLAAIPGGTAQAFDVMQSFGDSERRYNEKYVDVYRTPEKMDDVEFERMKLAHSTVLKHYLLPSVTRLLDRMGLREDIDQVLEKIIEKPNAFQYRLNNHGQLVITPRYGSETTEIVIENRTVVRVNGNNIPAVWQGVNAYRKRSDATNFAFTYGQQNEEDDVISNYNDIYLPHRLAKAMKLRGETDAEKASSALDNFKTLLKTHTQSPDDENGQLTVLGGVLEDGFEILKGAEDDFETIVVFTLDGYLKETKK